MHYVDYDVKLDVSVAYHHLIVVDGESSEFSTFYGYKNIMDFPSKISYNGITCKKNKIGIWEHREQKACTKNKNTSKG